MKVAVAHNVGQKVTSSPCQPVFSPSFSAGGLPIIRAFLVYSED